MNLGYKIWLESDGIILGEGLCNLLIFIERTGSISRAAAELKMSYRAAWGKIKEAEHRWGVSLVETKVGGEAGGGARLTEYAVQLVKQYNNFKAAVDKAIGDIYQQHFGN